MGERDRNAVLQRFLPMAPGSALIGRAVDFETNAVGMWRHKHSLHFICAMHPRATPIFKRELGEGNGRRHFFATTSFSGQKILEIIMIFSEFFQFVVFLSRLFFFSYGTEQLCHKADACNKKKKKKL
jgi:hypothetical protein